MYRPHLALPWAAPYGEMPRAHEATIADSKRAMMPTFFISINNGEVQFISFKRLSCGKFVT